MQSTARIAVSIFLLTSALASAYRDHNGAKLRRDGVLNLYPFPRVGRASHRTWQVPLNDFYLDYEPIEKRQLYAFPRVGRGDLSLLRGEPLRSDQLPLMPHRRTDSPGMWFGPRLGRSFKSEEDDYEPIEKRQLYAFPRVGRGDLSLLRGEPLRSDQLPLMPHRRTDSPGMWFGPRLGRSFKSEEDDITIQNENSEKSEPEQMEPEHIEREKRGINPLL